MTTSNLHFSNKTSHYWDNNGAWNAELDELTKDMPATGAAKTLNGELVRAINRLYYDYCNNGNMNVAEVTTVYNEWNEEEEEEVNWNSYYKKFFDLIAFSARNVMTELTGDVVNEIVIALQRVDYMVLNYGCLGDEFGDDNMHAYDVLADFVCWYCLNHDDKELPRWYEEK